MCTWRGIGAVGCRRLIRAGSKSHKDLQVDVSARPCLSICLRVWLPACIACLAHTPFFTDTPRRCASSSTRARAAVRPPCVRAFNVPPGPYCCSRRFPAGSRWRDASRLANQRSSIILTPSPPPPPCTHSRTRACSLSLHFRANTPTAAPRTPWFGCSHLNNRLEVDG